MPATPTFVLAEIAGAVRVTITNSDTVDSNEVYRQTGNENGGAAVRVAIGLGNDAVWDDYGVASGVNYSYFVRAITSGVAAASTSSTISITLSYLYLHAVDKRGVADNLYGTPLALINQPTESRDMSRVSDIFNLSGRDKSVVHISSITQQSFSCQIVIVNLADRDTLLDILYAGRYVCLRNQDGTKIYGALKNAPLEMNDPFPTNCNLTLDECSFIEHINDAPGRLGNLATGSYSSAEVELALYGENRPITLRTRVELLDKKNNVINDDYKGLIESESSVAYNADNDTPRTGTLTIREDDLDLDPYDIQVVDSAALVYVRLGESSGNFADSSGNSRTGTANGTITYLQSSLLAGALTNGAILPNGTTGYVSWADAAWMDVGQITLLAWVKGTGTNRAIWDRDDGSSNRFWRLSVSSAGQLTLSMTFTSGSPATKTFTAPGRINDGVAHMVAATYDGSRIRLYIDGLEAYSEAETRTMTTGTLAIRLGATNAGTLFTNYFLDEATLWGRALTPNEIRFFYKKGADRLKEVEILSDRLKIIRGVRMDDGGWAEFSDGVFLLRNPEQVSKESGVSIVRCQTYGKTILLNDITTLERYVVAASVNIITAVTAAIVAAGFSSSEISLPTTSLSTAAAREWDKGTSYLTIVNDLLLSINFENIRDNENGIFTSQEYVQPIDRSASFSLADDQFSLIIGDVGFNPNLVQRPNKVTTVDANPGTNTITGGATSDQWSNSGSTGPQGSTIEDVVPVVGVNQTIIDALAARFLTEETQTPLLKMNVSYIPNLGHRPIVNLTYNNVLKPYLLKSYSEPLSYAGLISLDGKEVVELGV